MASSAGDEARMRCKLRLQRIFFYIKPKSPCYTFYMELPRTTFTRDSFSSHRFLARLLELPQVPEKIIVEGSLPEITLDEQGFATPRILTVVGSRKHSTYGKDVIEHLLSSLHHQPVIIISGLALGIDALAHKEALKHNLMTISIPGSGLSREVLYPRSNITLAEEIVSNGGTLISELDDSTPAAQWTFPARNRIMAALSDAVLLIEAEEQSGTLITARHALELGKNIGVVPGSIFSPTSDGTHALLRDGATPITNSNDLFELLHLAQPEIKPSKTNLEDLTEDEQKLYSLLSEPRMKDTLLSLSNLAPQAFMIAITSLEMKGYIQETFGELRRVV